MISASGRSGNFVAINCAALPADIIEAELFGHEPGAFTGAQKQRIGKLEHANGGTIFLDEIESMPLDLQAKLLRAIETRSIERLGSNKTDPLDIRFVAATKSDLAMEGKRGELSPRSLLPAECRYTVESRPCTSGGKMFPLLFFHLAREARARYRREIPDVPSGWKPQLMAHDWPGNVANCATMPTVSCSACGRGFAEPEEDAHGPDDVEGAWQTLGAAGNL